MYAVLQIGGVSAALALVLTPLVGRAARLIGAMDYPGGRKLHDHPTPRLGGLALALAMVGALTVGWWFGWISPATLDGLTWKWLAVGGAIVVLVGACDDMLSLGPAAKLSGQLVSGVLAVWAGCSIVEVGNPLTGQSIALGWLSIPVTLLWIVGVTNAFNLIDGLDGLAAGVALIATLTLGGCGILLGHEALAPLLAALAGALLGFLRYNFQPASVFLGDSGSLLLGYVLAVASIASSQKSAATIVVGAPLLTLGLPIADTALAMARRLFTGLRFAHRDPAQGTYHVLREGSAAMFQADREHIHHRLLALGLTHRRAVLALYAIGASLGLLALLSIGVSGPGYVFITLVVAVASSLGIRALGYSDLLDRAWVGADSSLRVRQSLVQVPAAVLLDGAVLAIAYLGATLMFNDLPRELDHPRRLLAGLAVAVGLKLTVFVCGGVYDQHGRPLHFTRRMAGLVLLAQEVATVALLALSLAPTAGLPVMLLDLYLGGTLLAGCRHILAQRRPHRARATGADRELVLVYGADTADAMLASEQDELTPAGCRAVGIIADDPRLWGGSIGDLPILGGVDHLDDILRTLPIAGIVIAATARRRGIDLLADRCRLHNLALFEPRVSVTRIDPGAV